MRSRPAVVLAALAALVSGCTQPGTQAPLPYAQKLDEATSSMSSACGYAEELTAFEGRHARGLAKLDASAAGGARKLLLVYRRDRTWIYQGETVQGIVTDSILLLGDCGLPGAQRTLLRAITKGG